MRLSKAILLITILFVAGNLAGAMHYTLERGVDFGSKGLGHVLPLSDGKYVSFSLHDVDVFSVESDSLQFYQRLYSTQYYVDSKLCGVDTLLAITMQNRLDMYVYDQALGLRLVYEYPMASDDSLSYSNSAVIAGNGYVISSVYVNSGNQNTNNCQSIYSLNGTDTPALISRMYCSYEARFSRVEQVNQEYYYFGYDGRIYASSDLTNQPTQVTCSDLEGHIVIRSKVLEGSIYIISTDEASTAWLSKLGNVNNGNIDTDWMISLGNTPYPSFTELMNGYVFIFSYSIDDLTYIKKYVFSDSLQWQYVSSRSMPGDDYQLLPYNDGYVLFGYTSVRLLNSGLSTVVSLLAGEDTWWCDQVLLNRYLLLWNDQSWDHKLFDIENGQFLDQWFTGDYYKHTFRYGDNKLLFFGSRIEVATLDDHGISNYMTFPNDNEWYYGSVFDDQIVLFGDTGNVRKIYLYTIEADAAVQLSSMVVSQSVLAMQFYDTNHFAVIMVTGASTLSLKLYRIEEDNTFSLIGSYPATSQSIFVFGNILTAYATNGLVLDVSQPDSPVAVPHDPRWSYADMTYNGQHNYLQNWGEYSQIYDDNFQYVGYIENINPFFLDGNRVLFPGPTCAVIATLDDIVAVPQDENYTVTTPDIRLYNAPNPFNSSTTISFILPKTAHVNLTIYNIKGQKVVQLNDCKLKKGEYKLSWDSKDSNHKKVSSGLYFARLSTERTSSIRKIIIMK